MRASGARGRARPAPAAPRGAPRPFPSPPRCALAECRGHPSGGWSPGMRHPRGSPRGVSPRGPRAPLVEQLWWPSHLGEGRHGRVCRQSQHAPHQLVASSLYFRLAARSGSRS